MFPWIIAIILLLAAALLYYRTRAAGTTLTSGANVTQMLRRPPRAVHKPAVQRKDFHAVSIRCGTGACKAARVLEGKRGFPEQIPRLPLSQCNADVCTCTYAQHPDRRAQDDRRRLYATISGADADSGERRIVFDRRSDADEVELEAFNFSDT